MPRDQRGIAATELALISLAIIPMMLAVFDLSFMVWQRMQMQAALSAGAVYAQEFPTQIGGICQAIQNSGSLPAGAASVTTVTLTAPDCPDSTTTNLCGSGTPAPNQPLACNVGAAGASVALSISWSWLPTFLPALATNEVTYVVQVQ